MPAALSACRWSADCDPALVSSADEHQRPQRLSAGGSVSTAMPRRRRTVRRVAPAVSATTRVPARTAIATLRRRVTHDASSRTASAPLLSQFSVGPGAAPAVNARQRLLRVPWRTFVCHIEGAPERPAMRRACPTRGTVTSSSAGPSLSSKSTSPAASSSSRRVRPAVFARLTGDEPHVTGVASAVAGAGIGRDALHELAVGAGEPHPVPAPT